MEMAAKVETGLAFSGLYRIVSILNKNFGDVITTEETKPLDDFADCKIEVLTREAKPDDLAQLMSSLKELQAAALKLVDQLDLYEYDQLEKQVNSSSSEPLPKEKVIPKDLRDGLDKLLEIVKRVEYIRESITSKKGTTQRDSFEDFLVGESRIARPVINSALSDISRAIKMLSSNYRYSYSYKEILEQLKDAVRYHIQELIRNVNFHFLAESVQLLDMLQAASLQLDLFDLNQFYSPTLEKQISSSYSNPIEKFKPKIKLKEELGPILCKSPLRSGLERLLKFIEQMKINDPSITSSTGTTQPPLQIGVEKWLKFVVQVEKKHPFIASKEGTTRPQGNTYASITTTFFPVRRFLSLTSLENGKCQEDAEEIMRNHKNNLKELIFGWTNIASSSNTCKEVLERLEPGQNLEILSIISYSCSKLPNWMEKENWLPRLRVLRFESCTSLKIVPFLPPCLESLCVENCRELMQLPSLPPRLGRLYVGNCQELMQLPLVSDTLHFVELYGCPKLTSLGNLQRCTSLKELKIRKCPMLRREEASLVEGVVEGDIANPLPQVEEIETDEPLLVLELVGRQAFGSVRALGLTGCAALPNRKKKFSSMFTVSGLQSPIQFGTQIKRHGLRGCAVLPNLKQAFSPLKIFTVTDCAAAALPNLEQFSSLYRLSIDHCPDVERLPNLPVSLQHLWIDGCPKLKEKYEEGGLLRSTISHIPNIDIN